MRVHRLRRQGFFQRGLEPISIFFTKLSRRPWLLRSDCNMPITPRARAEGLAKGGNALGLEGAKNETLSGRQVFHASGDYIV